MEMILQEIINFAINSEVEATKFYRHLQTLVKNDSARLTLKELEDMEISHAEYLRNIDLKQVQIETFPDPEDLKLSNYLVEVIPNAQMTFQDVLVIAMKREDKANVLYSKMADTLAPGALKILLLKLATDEAMHKAMLEKMYDEEIYKEN
jgi:rubrerythrin